jgi:hypothetical protein
MDEAKFRNRLGSASEAAAGINIEIGCLLQYWDSHDNMLSRLFTARSDAQEALNHIEHAIKELRQE